MSCVFCYDIDNKERLEYYKNYKQISPDPENYQRCVARERWKELEAIKQNNIPLFFFKKNKNILIQAKKCSILDSNFKKIKSKNHTKVFIRASIENISLMIRTLQLNGFEPILNTRDNFAVNYWPLFVEDSFVKRRIQIHEAQALLYHEFRKEIIDYFTKDYEKYFLKTLFKESFDIIDVKEPIYNTGRMHWFEANKQLIISEYIEIKEDKLGSIEYRAFIIDNKISGISRYIDYNKDYKIPVEATNFIRSFIKCHKFILPPHYVVDIADTSKGLCVIELNGVFGSGRYEKISANKLIKDIGEL